MARPLRLAFADGVYHVTARGNKRKAIVRDDTDGARFLDTLAAMVGQVYLGGEAFIRRVLHHGVPRAADSEIRRRQREPCWLAPETVLQRVAQGYGVDVRAVVRPTRRPSEARQVALYGLRRWAGEALPAIARRMGVSYSAVSRRVSAVARRQGEERRFRERLARLSDGKIQT